MAPMKVNDLIEYSGVKVGDQIICYEITVNIGIYTQPGVAPGFIRVEDAIIGVSGNNPDLEAGRAKVNSRQMSKVKSKLVLMSDLSLAAS